MTQELKPCPFCGAAMELVKGGFKHPELGDYHTCVLEGLSWAATYYAASWNTRAPASPVEAAADDLVPVVAEAILHMVASEPASDSFEEAAERLARTAIDAIAKATGQQVAA